MIALSEQVEDPQLGESPEEIVNHTSISSTMDVTLAINLIRSVETQIERLQKQDSDSRMFYADRVARCEQRISDVKLSILGYLQQHGMKNIQTPSGTAYQKVVTVKHWSPEDVLLSWAEKHLPDAVRVKRESDKKRIGDHIKRTGEAPDGYSESNETRLYIR